MSTRRLLLCSLGCVLLAGCALGTQRFGRVIDAERIASLEVGVSSKADVLRLFGPPTATSRLPVVAPAESPAQGLEAPGEPDPEVFVYEYREDRETFFYRFQRRAETRLALSFYLKLFQREEEREVDGTLLVAFDAEDRLLHHGRSELPPEDLADDLGLR